MRESIPGEILTKGGPRAGVCSGRHLGFALWGARGSKDQAKEAPGCENPTQDAFQPRADQGRACVREDTSGLRFVAPRAPRIQLRMPQDARTQPRMHFNQGRTKGGRVFGKTSRVCALGRQGFQGSSQGSPLGLARKRAPTLPKSLETRCGLHQIELGHNKMVGNTAGACAEARSDASEIARNPLGLAPN